MSIFNKLLIFIISIFLLAACSHKENKNTIQVGVITGPETQLMQVAKKIAWEKYKLDINIVQFNDYIMPNEALVNGDIDANMFQHMPYLKAQIKERGYKLVSVGKTFIYPVGIYSKKIKKISEVPNGAKVAIPNDPSNEARALLLLQKTGLIKLKSGGTINSTVEDIVSNPKQLSIDTIDAAQIPRALNDVTLAIINTNYAMVAGLTPKKDAIFMENKHSPYANIVVVRAADKNDSRFKELVNALHSKAVIQEANRLFKGQAIAAW